MELFTRPAKEKCNLDVLHNLTLKHLIAVLGFRALVSIATGIGCGCFQVAYVMADIQWERATLWEGWEITPASFAVVYVEQAQCWVMILVLILPLPDGWSESHLCAFREEICFKVSCSLSEGGDVWQCWDDAQQEWTQGTPHHSGWVME